MGMARVEHARMSFWAVEMLGGTDQSDGSV